MRVADAAGVDLIEEFRLRKWARENYARPERRSGAWHPIVLEEMQFRDAERESESPAGMAHSPFVPLAPMESFYVDPPHPAVPPPKSLMSLPADVEACLG